ncbi:hypothetical protein ANN_02121 [Periplaneta americana]|uniref:Uncharacterized protein n=1 Tax=Periplaneta americana TaxID=6978 RepID=A0ABQ8TYD4_PERAM|nr:hypothetical protein ANN_02121 [Periplaneta americana]
MSPGSSTESYPAFAHIGLRENLGKTSTRNVINLVDKFRATECTERKKSVRWPTKVTEDAVEDARERMQRGRNKSVKKLAVEIEVSYGSAHKILRNKLVRPVYVIDVYKLTPSNDPKERSRRARDLTVASDNPSAIEFVQGGKLRKKERKEEKKERNEERKSKERKEERRKEERKKETKKERNEERKEGRKKQRNEERKNKERKKERKGRKERKKIRKKGRKKGNEEGKKRRKAGRKKETKKRRKKEQRKEGRKK